MRVLVDTNIFIYREGHSVLPENLQQLEKKLRENAIQILVHPESLNEVKTDANEERREINLSKITAYPTLEGPTYAFGKDTEFDSKIGAPKNENEQTDNALLYSVYRNAIDYFITNDVEIIKKAAKVDLSDRVLEIDDALDLFRRLYPDGTRPAAPPALQEIPISMIDINEPILGTLRKEYYDFDEWFKKISRKGRKAWVYHDSEMKLRAIMTYKLEEDALELQNETVEPKKRLKICLLKSEAQGQKIGELFLKMAFEFALKNGVRDLYLTHFVTEQDRLVNLIQDYGFYCIGKTKKYGDGVFYKRIYPEGKEQETLESVSMDKLFYPALYDGTKVNKFLIPIQPQFHERLFIEQPRTPKLMEYQGEMIIEGNSITKAYLSNAITLRLKPGDVLLFYLSGGRSQITCVGSVEKAYSRQTDSSQVQKQVGKRTVYSFAEIKEMTKKPTLVIIFRWHFNLKKPVDYENLKRAGVLA
ncbi:hypothetical protein COV61_03200, partial [Candidatus Micrarchaeota archaeon CG11_big_fil_rev_8_21_14_0_20_47_5]